MPLFLHAVAVEETEGAFLEVFAAQVMGMAGQIELLKVLAVFDKFGYYLKGGGGIDIVIHLTVYEEQFSLHTPCVVYV